MSLRILRPITLTDANFVSSSEPEADAAAWAVGTTYAAAARVMYQHSVYESLQAANVGKTPGDAASAAWWLKVGPTNRWAMFDGAVSTQTIGASASLVTVLQTVDEFVTAVGVVNAAGDTVRVQMVKDSITYFDETRTLNAGTAADFWEWFYGERVQVGALLFDGLPPLLGAQITVTVTAAASPAVGVLALGRVHEIGGVEYGAEVGITDYSRKETDTFGTTTLQAGDYANRATFSVLVDTPDMRRVNALITSLRASPALYVGDDDTDTYGPLTVYGWPRDWRQVVQFPTQTHMSLEVEGLT